MNTLASVLKHTINDKYCVWLILGFISNRERRTLVIFQGYTSLGLNGNLGYHTGKLCAHPEYGNNVVVYECVCVFLYQHCIMSVYKYNTVIILCEQ